MKKTLKILGIILLSFLVISVVVGIYFYETHPMINNDESKLYYSPSKEIDSMEDMNYVETILKVDDSLDIYTYYFSPETESPKANIFFIHSAGGNVSKYKSMISMLLKNGFKVYAMDWRGYGQFYRQARL